MLDILLNVYDTKYLSIATYGVALAFTLLAAFAPTRGALLSQRESASPLWLLVPVLVAAGLLSVGRGDLLVVTAGANALPFMFLVQVVVSLWVLWRNRGFPWLVVLAALASGWIQWSFFMAALSHRVRVSGFPVLLAGIVGCGGLTGAVKPVVCPAPSVTAPRPVIVEVPEVYELANIILALTNYQSLAAHTVLDGPYLAQVRAHFAGMRAHPLVATLNARLTSSGSWNYDAYYGFRENSFVYHFGAAGLEHSPAYTRAWGGTDVFSAEIRRVEDFADRSGFRAFYADHLALYEDQIRRYQELVSVDRMWRWLETRFPARYDRYRIVFSPLINGSHSTQRFATGGVRETVMFIAGPDVVASTVDAPLRTAHLERLVFTEIDHNYVNPATDRYGGSVRRIFDDVSFWNGDANNYRSPTATFNEYMTWAVFNLYARDAYDAATSAAIRESVITSMVRNRRFHKFREFEQVVQDVYATAESQPCIPNLYGEILHRAAGIQ